MRITKTHQHYVNNKDFYAALVAWREERELASKRSDPPPEMSSYIADCIYRIATRLSYRPNFINYSYKEEMIGDGLEHCIRYADRFNPEKSENPFAYFTQITYNAYIRRITKEKRQSEIRNKMIRSEVKTFDTMQGKYADDTSYSCLTQKIEHGSYSMGRPALFTTEPNLSPPPPKKKKTPPKGLELFMTQKIEEKELVAS